MVEANWVDRGTFRHDSNLVVNGFKSGTICYGRWRGIGTNGPGVWAVSAGVMAVLAS